MDTNKMREEFESWECDAGQGPQTDPMWLMYDAKTNTYPLDKIQGHWLVWQASRESLVVELPDDGIEDCQKAWGGLCKNTFDCGYNFASQRHEQAIEDAGVKVKP